MYFINSLWESILLKQLTAVFLVTLRVTDESANHTISNVIQYYWFDCGIVFNEMPRLYIIDLIVTISCGTAWLCVHYSSALVYKIAACIWVITFTYVALYAYELIQWWWFRNDGEQLRRTVLWAWWLKWKSRWNECEDAKQQMKSSVGPCNTTAGNSKAW